MVFLLMVHGTCKNLFICGGNNGIAKVIAVTIVWSIERKKEKLLVIILSNIMVNGHLSAYMGSRCDSLTAMLYTYLGNKYS